MKIYEVKVEYLEPAWAELEAGGNNPEELQENVIKYFADMGAVDVKITYLKELGDHSQYIQTNGTIN